MAEDWRDVCFDLTRGIAAYTGNALVADLARTVGRHPQARIGTAFNHKQVASKVWARDSLFATLGGRFGTILIVLVFAWNELIFAIIRLTQRRRAPDILRTLFYRPELLGANMGAYTQAVMRGPSDWSVWERELFAAFTSRLNQCVF